MNGYRDNTPGNRYTPRWAFWDGGYHSCHQRERAERVGTSARSPGPAVSGRLDDPLPTDPKKPVQDC